MTTWQDRNPQNIAQAGDLTRSEKLTILREMELDAESLSVAEEENMGGGEHLSLRAVRQAIRDVESQL